MIQLHFLGTSAGVPTAHRNVSALAVEFLHQERHQGWILVDCGEGTQHQLLKSKLKPKNLKAILITHLHGDHCFGILGLLSSLSMQKRSEPLTIIAPKALIALLDTAAIVNALYFAFEIAFVAIEQLPKAYILPISTQCSLAIHTVPLSHRISSYAFVLTATTHTQKPDIAKLQAHNIPKAQWKNTFTSNPKFAIIQNQSQKIVIAGDNDTPELLAQAVQGAAALVHECTYTQAVLDAILAKNDFDPMHTTAYQIGAFAQRARVPMLLLTHFSARYAPFDDPATKTPNMGHIRTEVCQQYTGQLILASDGMIVSIENP